MAKSAERIYTIYNMMMQRCYNKNTKNYFRYGGRGIKVCNEWKNDFYSFRNWAYENGYDENAPRGACTIDRIDCDGDYEPSNCRFVDMKVQRENQHPRWTFTDRPVHHKNKGKYGSYESKHMWTIGDKTMNANGWCKLYGLSYPYVMYRIKKMGMTPYEALTAPKKQSGRPYKRRDV